MREAAASVWLLLLMASMATPIAAQAVYGTIVGTVLDSTGAVVPKAKVIITDPSRALTFSTSTNESGLFSQRFLTAGKYEIRVEASGFRAHLQDVSVSVARYMRGWPLRRRCRSTRPGAGPPS
jgi:hypothetical protein